MAASSDLASNCNTCECFCSYTLVCVWSIILLVCSVVLKLLRKISRLPARFLLLLVMLVRCLHNNLFTLWQELCLQRVVYYYQSICVICTTITGKPNDGSWSEDSFTPCSGNLSLLMGTVMYVRTIVLNPVNNYCMTGRAITGSIHGSIGPTAGRDNTYPRTSTL